MTSTTTQASSFVPINPFSRTEFAIMTIMEASPTSPKDAELDTGATSYLHDIILQSDPTTNQKATARLLYADNLVKRQVVCITSCLEGAQARPKPDPLLVGFSDAENRMQLLTVPKNASNGKLAPFPAFPPQAKTSCLGIVSAKITKLEVMDTSASSSSSATSSSAAATAAKITKTTQSYVVTLDTGSHGTHKAILRGLKEQTASNYKNARVAAFVHGQSISHDIDAEVLTVPVDGEELPFCIDRLIFDGCLTLPSLGVKLSGV